MNIKDYKALAEKSAPKSPILKDVIFAFLIGGLVCSIGQVFINLYLRFGAEKEVASALASITLIFIAVFLTALNVFDNIAKIAGAGTIVPITGFANSVASPAIEFKSEGFVLGAAANMFKIAGPVIVFGIVASVVYGVIYWVIQVL